MIKIQSIGGVLKVFVPLFGAALATMPAIGKAHKNPNIIFILADDLGYGDVSAFSKESKIQTSNLDRLAKQGATFTDAHSSSAVCTPTRYGILTGRYNWRSTLKSGVLNGYSPALIPRGRKTVAALLKEKNYQTACIGKWHLGWTWNSIGKGKDSINYTLPIQDGPTTLGFDYFYGFSGSLDMDPYVYVENDRPTALPNRITQSAGMKMWRKGPTASDFDHEQTLPNLISRAEKYIGEKSKDLQPFFLYLALPAPHTPILPIKEFQGMSGLNPYGDFVLMVDAMVGRVMAMVDKVGIGENTIIVFTSDNGCSPMADFGALKAKGHNPSFIFRGHKADLFDGGHRIPCIVRWPAKVKSHQVNQTICLTDFFATFSAVTGYQPKDNEGEDSYNILPLLVNAKPQKNIREATVHHSIDGNFTIRKGEWKLLFSAGSGGWSSPKSNEKSYKSLPPMQLYNMRSDPAESKNLCDLYPDVVQDLRSLMIRYIKEGRSTPGKPQQNDGKEFALE